MLCTKCGSANPSGNSFCLNCGARLTFHDQPTVGKLSDNSAQTISMSAEDGASLIGHIIDNRYRLEARLGQGGMGAVYRATRLNIGDEVAVKILHSNQQDARAAERFRREAQAAARLKHPNAVVIHDFGITTEGLQYLVMELVEGEDLRTLIKRGGAMNVTRAVEIITQVCSALDEAHSHGIVHRDIKPDNIIVKQGTGRVRVKVLDFGIAKLKDAAASHLTQTGSVMGTPHYMSPEQCVGEEIDARSDIYSLGVVLYEMLTGSVPFNAPNSNAIVVQHVMNAPPALRERRSDIPVAVEAVVLHALQKQKEARPQTASALAQELITAVNEYNLPRTVAAQPPPHHTPPPQSRVTPPGSSSGTQPTLVINTPSTGNPTAQPVYYQPAPQQPQAYTQPSKNYLPLIAGVVIGLVLAGGALVLVLRSSGSDSRNDVVRNNDNRSNDNRTSSNNSSQSNNNNSASANNSSTSNSPSSPSGDAYSRAESKVVSGNVISESDLAGLSAYQLQLLRNAVFARHGRLFKTPELQRYFDSKSWYSPRAGYTDDELTSSDRSNVELIKAAEKRAGG
jgi:serine/threonine protein kinase